MTSMKCVSCVYRCVCVCVCVCTCTHEQWKVCGEVCGNTHPSIFSRKLSLYFLGKKNCLYKHPTLADEFLYQGDTDYNFINHCAHIWK